MLELIILFEKKKDSQKFVEVKFENVQYLLSYHCILLLVKINYNIYLKKYIYKSIYNFLFFKDIKAKF